jgi:hypothetical protein
VLSGHAGSLAMHFFQQLVAGRLSKIATNEKYSIDNAMTQNNPEI